MPNKNQKGASLIGLLSAVAIIGLTLTAGLALMSRNIRMSSVAAHEITASALAEEGVELVRNIRDTGDNYCIAHGLSLNGFQRLTDLSNHSIAVDAWMTTYTADEPNYRSGSFQPGFDSQTAGLCPHVLSSGAKAYRTCSVNSNDREFIREIELLTSGESRDETAYRCQEAAGESSEGGLMVVSTVYW